MSTRSTSCLAVVAALVALLHSDCGGKTSLEEEGVTGTREAGGAFTGDQGFEPAGVGGQAPEASPLQSQEVPGIGGGIPPATATGGLGPVTGGLVPATGGATPRPPATGGLGPDIDGFVPLGGCGALLCGSAADGNCNGTPDNEELACSVCIPGVEFSSCNEHPGYDGVGACRAGARPCLPVGSRGAGVWGSCEGDIGPSIEGCGPTSPDTDCNGIAGDGAGCLTTLRIYTEMTSATCTEGVLRNEPYSPYGQVTAAEDSPGSQWVELVSLRVFTGPYPGTVPIRNCRAWDWTGGTYDYVNVGDSCVNPDPNLDWEELGVVGYLSRMTAPGYRPLEQVSLQYSYYHSDGYVPIATVPVLNCPASCTCTTSSAFAIP